MVSAPFGPSGYPMPMAGGPQIYPQNNGGAMNVPPFPGGFPQPGFNNPGINNPLAVQYSMAPPQQPMEFPPQPQFQQPAPPPAGFSNPGFQNPGFSNPQGGPQFSVAGPPQGFQQGGFPQMGFPLQNPPIVYGPPQQQQPFGAPGTAGPAPYPMNYMA